MEEIDFSQFILAFAFVLGLIGLMGFALKRYGRATGLVAKAGAGRIQVVEVTPLDYKRRLVLVKRDDVEHLILVADGRETVVETGIRAGK
jgi:flagellar protein FliO/FliZ